MPKGNVLENHQVYGFGPFRLDAAAKVLFKEDQPLHLTRKAVETLVILASRSPEVVTKDELLHAVWQGRVVDEANLAQNVAVIRKALGAGKGDPAYIETFPGRGYRLHGPVSLVAPLGPQPVRPEVLSPHGRRIQASAWLALAAASILLVLGAAVLMTRTESVKDALAVTSVTRLAGMEYQPAISPDGSQVAFVWQQDERQMPGIWIQKLTESTPRQITQPGFAWYSPSWSPDGASIAGIRFGPTSGDIVILPVNGGPTRTVAPILPTRFGLPHFHLDWSPDGKMLAVDDSPSLSQPLSIFLLNLESGKKTRLTQPEELIIGDLAPRFSPDGRTVAFIRAFHRSQQELYTVPVSGGTASPVTPNSLQVSSVDWAGADLLFGQSRGGEFRIWRYSSGKAPAPTSVYAEFPIQFTLARKSSRLVYSIAQNDPNIWRLSLSTTPVWTRVAASSGQDASPQYSPDGSQIAFRSDRSGSEQIWTCSTDGSNPVQVTRGAARPSVPRWSPDNRSIVFNDTASTEIFLAQWGGAGWSVKPFGARGVHPVFSPDGRFIYAAAAGSVLRLPAEGGQPAVVTPTRGLSLDVSPDGEYVYFVREPADTTLSRVQVATGRLETILQGLVPYCTSCWALSEQGIYYLGVRPKSPNQQSIYFMDLRSRSTRQVAEYPEPVLPIGMGPFSLSPDRKSLLTVRVEPSNSDIQRVDNFR
ncbi:MAG: hypothetical protein FJW20_04165 [Acidimicrobiia bacterium]|nr:hypothetical protein [Acidimicrobiia bacterium]